MEHQDWNNITFNTKTEREKINKSKEQTKEISNKQFNPETTKLEAPSNLGQTISQARLAKGLNQGALAKQSGISKQIISKWESNKETPDNSQIAKLEKLLGVKLPRCKKVKLDKT